jgi:hypothetical protein
MKIICQNCGRRIEVIERVGFRDVCQSCDAWLHSCVHCRFWSGSNCTEPSADKVGDPEAQNFCEWYKERAQPFDQAHGPESVEGVAGRSAQECEGRAEAEELWKKLTKK